MATERSKEKIQQKDQQRPNRRWKKKGQRKEYKIEARYIGNMQLIGHQNGVFLELFRKHREWHDFKSYANQKARDQALDRYVSGRAGYGKGKWEFRAKELRSEQEEGKAN